MEVDNEVLALLGIRKSLRLKDKKEKERKEKKKM